MPQAVLFDLDGTLFDTAPDLVFALNKLRREYQLPDLLLSEVRATVGLGSKMMIKQLLGINEEEPVFSQLRSRFLTLYEEHIADATQPFPYIEQILAHLEQTRIPWGIVTNKLEYHTHQLLKALGFDQSVSCVVCGDTLSTYKPDPAPILYACEQLHCAPADCLYVGDSQIDVLASQRAGVKVIVALYGYISPQEDPYAWKADGYVHTALDIMNWL